MKIRSLLFTFSILAMFQQLYSQEKNPIDDILNQNPSLFKNILAHPENNEVQIIYTQIDRDKKNKPHFKTYSYHLDDHHYFYPASTVKLPTAIFALEKLNELGIKGLDKYTPLKIGADFGSQTPVLADSSALNGDASIAHYIKKILLVSDNDAFNRIYEFTDRSTINQKLKKYGFDHSRIIGRLAIGDGGENAEHTNPIDFYKDGHIVYHKPSAYDPKEYPMELEHMLVGKGYMDSRDSLVTAPFDFSEKNVYQLSDQHELMKRLIFPNSYPIKKRFNLKPDDYDFLYTYMSKYPTESKDPKYDPQEFFPACEKFLFYGADKNAVIQPNIRIFNKIGDSYGYTMDNMYFLDYENKVEFFLSAVIQSNNNEIYNDSVYEYDTVCFPFLKNLAQQVYELELKRPKKYLPDLSRLLKYQ